jgi:predicted DCC family thiol-disulfide oxidoreductase YuxK
MNAPVPPDDARHDEPALIYDAECPVCTSYSQAVDVGGELRRIDARSDDPLVRQAREAGLDLDEGMVVAYQGRLYHGADALHLMARLAPSHGIGNRLNKLLFGNAAASRVAYPVLRGGRNLLLRMLGRTKIRDMKRPD